MKIAILYGTETGNAEMLAEDVAAHLDGDHDVSCANLADTDPTALEPDAFHLVICSTYGDGELPASAQPFADALAEKAPDLSAIRFAVFGLGDMEYPDTFNGGSAEICRILTEHGARQVGARVVHDASGPDMPEDLALPWADAVVAEALAGAEA